MKTDSLIEAINGIKDDYVTEYDPTESVVTGSGKVISIDSRRMKGVNGMKKISIWLSAAAAVLVLGVGIFAINHFVKNSGSEHHAAVPTAIPTETAAVDPTQPAQTITCSILEVMNPQLAESPFTHRNDIRETTAVSFDAAKQNSTKTVEFMGRQYEAEYKQTIKYLFGNTTVDQFSVIGRESDSFLLLSDGTIYAALVSPAATLDIDEYANKETVRAAVEAALKDTIDFTAFEFCDVEGSVEDTTDGFGTYRLMWYNKKYGFMTGETVQVSVRQNGEVGSVWMKNTVDLGLDALTDSFSIEDYSGMIEEELRTIYGDAMTGYEVMWASLTNYEGKPCLDCTIGVNGEAWSEACELAIVIGG
ncbi:MAG: hypothetical protein J5586_08515 [Clostridia bacterium]|nr:hypothetical protein [Clostridia bacterium]